MSNFFVEENSIIQPNLQSTNLTSPLRFKSVKTIFSTDASPALVGKVRRDCLKIFSARCIEDGGSYSTGSTFFIKAASKPRCLLEQIALSIFLQHTKSIVYDAEVSGAEWWSQVIHIDDDIGLHWDRDYGAEEDEGVHLYPYLATVTYLSDIGGPTLVMNKTGTASSTDDPSGDIDYLIASEPRTGKHICFDGRLLHGAPSSLFESQDDSDGSSGDYDDSDESSGDHDVPLDRKRITLLVNIWISSKPRLSESLPARIAKKLNAASANLECFPSAIFASTSSSRETSSTVDVIMPPEICIDPNPDHTSSWCFRTNEDEFRVSIPHSVVAQQSMQQALTSSGDGVAILRFRASAPARMDRA